MTLSADALNQRSPYALTQLGQRVTASTTSGSTTTPEATK